MPNWVKQSDDKKRTLIADVLKEIESKFPLKDDEDFEVLLKCFYSIKENKFVEAHFQALLKIPNGKNYWNVIKNIALKGNVADSVIDAFERDNF